VQCFEVCAGCPVRRDCLEYALGSTFDVYGAWGGSVLVERLAVIKRPAAAPDEKSKRAPDPSEVQAAADVLERTFEARLRHWRQKAEEHRRSLAARRYRGEERVCAVCGEVFRTFRFRGYTICKRHPEIRRRERAERAS
jgi:hypothetical protein